MAAARLPTTAYLLSIALLCLVALSVARDSLGGARRTAVAAAGVALLLGAAGAAGLAGPLERRDADEGYEAERLAYRTSFAVANHRGGYISGRTPVEGGEGGAKDGGRG